MKKQNGKNGHPDGRRPTWEVSGARGSISAFPYRGTANALSRDFLAGQNLALRAMLMAFAAEVDKEGGGSGCIGCAWKAADQAALNVSMHFHTTKCPAQHDGAGSVLGVNDEHHRATSGLEAISKEKYDALISDDDPEGGDNLPPADGDAKQLEVS